MYKIRKLFKYSVKYYISNITHEKKCQWGAIHYKLVKMENLPVIFQPLGNVLLQIILSFSSTYFIVIIS